MNTLLLFARTKKAAFLKFWLISLALVSGLILSIFSWLELCVENCTLNQDYRLFGLPFTLFGIAFFSLTLIFHFLSTLFPFFSWIVRCLIAAALGAEIMFLAVQHYQIGHWCPICISIAGTVAFSAFVMCVSHIIKLKTAVQHHIRGDIMLNIKKGLHFLFFVFLGFFTAFIGVGKFNAAEAAMIEMKDRLIFGNKNGPIEVYFVTDWFCPACKKIELEIEKLYPQIEKEVAFYFIDFPIHKKSLNFTPYNLSFMINNKNQYFKARQVLSTLSEKTETPNDEKVETAANKKGISFKELSFLDIKSGIEFFDMIVTKYKLRSTPAIIIVNPKKDQVVKMEGRDEINKKKILNAIEKMH